MPIRYRLIVPLVALAGLVQLHACRRAPAATSPEVWAVVNDREIRREDVDAAYRRVAKPTPPVPSDEEVLLLKMQILEELIDQEILLERARVLNIDVADTEVETAFNERKSNMPDPAFQKELDQRQLTVDGMKRALKRELVVQKVMTEQIGKQVSVTDAEARDFYEKNRAQFNVPETQYRVAQIVVTPIRDQEIRNRMKDDAASPAEAQRKLEMLAEKLKGGADFGTLAMDYSEDPQTAPQGGDLGFIPTSALNQVPPQLRTAVLQTDPGNVSRVSAGGAHTLVLVIAREAAGQRELSTPAVREAIDRALRERKEQVLRAAYVAAARNDLTVKNHLARMIVEAQGKLPNLAPAAPGK